MRYRDLIQFEPVEDVIKLRQADDRQKAASLISTYVISDRMADVLLHRILPSLDLTNVGEGGGLFVVGNYGTGKSHLMSVVSAVAEHADLLERLTHPAVAQGLKPVAGRFKVIRQEFGSTNMALRDVVVHYIEKGLATLEVDYHFPSMDEAPNAKDPLAEMMHAFHLRYPDHGLLVVIDELLEYLQARKDRELIRDLGFLREVGEICEQTQLRFIAGLQESLFDSPHFQFAADSVRRVKDRFDQVRIVREDVAYVVSRRLLAKTQAQRGQIRAHLERFTSLYDSMAENLEAFVDLFPVHPAYLEVFEMVSVIEKRQVLKALSQEMRARLEAQVPEGEPGLLSFDSYWEMIKADAAYRSIPEIREVLDKSRVLEDRVKNALALEAYKPAALRILNALALHRLSTSDLRAPIGLTAKELRDRLCLSLPMPESDANFLLITVEAVLSEVAKTVSGQFISKNAENGQYYLDLDKDIDFDALIIQKADTLGDESLDRYYFDMLAHALELTDSAHVPGFRIWQREIPWLGQGITRLGYIFLGASNERSTAQPPRDFYLHFLALNSTNGKDHKSEPDEVFFTQVQRDVKFDEALRRYAGAREMGLISSGDYRLRYEEKADRYRLQMVNWLRENLLRVFEIRYRDERLTPAEVMSRHHIAVSEMALRDQVFRLAAACLGEHWGSRYPGYPRFSQVTFTMDSLPQGANAALKSIAGGSTPRNAQSVLEALQVARLDGGQLIFTTEESPYACAVLEQLHALPPGNVLNRSALLSGRAEAEREPRFGLEPPLVVVVLLALVRQGEISLNVLGKHVDSDDLEDAARLGVEELAKFTSLSLPKALPEQALRALFAGLGLPEGYISDASKHGLAVEQLQAVALKDLNETARAIESLREGPQYWGQALLSPAEMQDWRDGLSAYKTFLDSLQHIDLPGKLRNFSYGVGEVKQRLRARQTLAELRTLNETLQGLAAHLDYIYQASLNLPSGHPWHAESEKLRKAHLETLSDPQRRGAAHARAALSSGLADLRAAYAQAYLELHNQARLNATQDARKQRLVKDVRWGQLRALASLELLPESALEKLEKQLGELHSCPGLGLSDLKTHTTCSCGYVPRSDTHDSTALQRLEKIESDLERLYAQWVQTLRQNLQQESQQENIHLLPDKVREAVQAYVIGGELPEKMTKAFVDGLQDALQGLEKVAFDGADLLLALTKPGMPCTPEELHRRFNHFLEAQVSQKDASKVRVQIDW